MAERLGFPFKKLVCFPSLFILQNVSQILTHFEPRLSFSVERNILSTVHSTTSRSFLTYCGTFFLLLVSILVRIQYPFIIVDTILYSEQCFILPSDNAFTTTFTAYSILTCIYC